MQIHNVYVTDPATGHLMLAREEKVPNYGELKLGQVVATPAVLSEIPDAEIRRALGRHRHGDWGVCCSEDWKANNVSWRKGARILSVYEYTRGKDTKKFWIITEADRSYTTVLLPSDY